MALLEGLLALTSVLCKTGFKMIVEDDILAQETSNELIDIIREKVKPPRKQRQLVRFFESIAEESADRLEKLTKSYEYQVPENEKIAATFAVQRTFENASISISKVIKNNLDPQALEIEILASGKLDYETLSSQAKSYFDLLLRDSCTIAVEIVRTVPKINSLLNTEILKRSDELLDNIALVLEQISNSSVSSEKKDKDFETRYLRTISNKLKSYSLFGLDVSNSLKKIDLDVSYISLTGTLEDDYDYEETKIESILYKHNKVIISGSPGSGKTTLVQWIALKAAKRAFPDYLSKWNNKIPFIVSLREFSSKELPTPAKFVEFSSSILRDSIPDEWVDRILTSGNAIILIDGLDEINEQKRHDTLEWLNELVTIYPNCSFIVTSRPNALDEEWLYYSGMAHVELQPMTPTNIFQFIEHWHKAAERTQDKGSLDSFKMKLKAQISENSRLRNMASSPLLCAMLCALNIDRGAILPQERGELYRVVMEVLLERRDSERKVASHIDITLTRAQKELLLQHLAYWMLLNNKQTVTIEDAENCFSKAMRSMPNLHESESAICKYLLERSSVIRESSVGNVDFIHKTFSEYLAAKYLVEDNSIELIVDNAQHDSWKEVVVMSSMHTNLNQSNKLINLLIQKGHQDPTNRYTLHLLSVVAKETTLQLSKEISQEVDLLLKSLLPPRDREAVVSIASAGEFVAPYLKLIPNMSFVEQSLSMKALVLISGSSAIEILASYCVSTDERTHAELVSYWEYFDQSEYARKVISSIPEIEELHWPSDHTLSGICELKNVSHLVIRDSHADNCDYNQLKELNIERLSLIDCHNLTDLNFISTNKKLTKLEIRNINRLSFIDGVLSLTDLEKLSIINCPNIRKIPNLKNLCKLEDLDLTGCSELRDIDFLEKHPSIRLLNIDRCSSLSDLFKLGSCKNLESIQTDELSLEETLPINTKNLVW